MTAWLAQHLIITVLLTIVVAVLCRLLRLRPAVCHALWLLVLLKLLTPPVVAWPWTIAQLVDGLQHLSAERSASVQTEAPDTNVLISSGSRTSPSRFLAIDSTKLTGPPGTMPHAQRGA